MRQIENSNNRYKRQPTPSKIIKYLGHLQSQGSAYGTLLFTLYINDILIQTESKFKDLPILVFIEDIMIAMNFIHDMIEELNMELNLNKCELLYENEDDTIINKKME